MTTTTVLTNSPNTFDIPLASVVADPKTNTRTVMDDVEFKELVESIKRQGQIQAVEVTQRADGKFDLILGFRRFAALKSLESPTIRCQLTKDKDGNPLDRKSRKIRNMSENLARENLTPFDQAVGFFDLKKNEDMSSQAIANNVGKSVSYVNNLIRVYEGLDESVIKRWKEECNPNFGYDKDGKKLPNMRQVCTMNWLTDLVGNKEIPKSNQELELRRALGLIPDEDEDDDDDEEGGRGAKDINDNPKRPSMGNLKKALEAAEAKRKEAKSEKEKEWCDGVVVTLKYAVGRNQSIKGVYTNPKQGESAD